MSRDRVQAEAATELRRQAEARATDRSALAARHLEALLPEDTRHMLHELRVHQIELELQNEELRRTSVELDALRAMYFDLYDIAPVGYCTLDAQGIILQAMVEAGIPSELRDQMGVQGYPNRICSTQGHCARQAVTVVCAGNLDDDSTVEVWSLSTMPRRVWGGADIPAHVPFHHVDDLSPNPGVPPRVQAGQPMAERVEPVEATPAQSEVERGPGDWSSYSADGQWRLKQRSNGNSCELQCTGVDGTQVWQHTGPCMATQSEWRFVGPKCARTVVLVPSPDRAQHQWGITPVVRYYTRGVLTKVQIGASLLPERQFRASPSWLQGCYGVPGEEPRYGRDGQSLEFTVINGQAMRISLVEGPDDALDVRAESEAAVLAQPPKKKKRSKSPTRR